MKRSFENSEGRPDGRAITIALSFVMLCIMTVGDQWFEKDIKPAIFDSFWWIVVIGLGILSPSIVNKLPIKFLSNEKTSSSNDNISNRSDTNINSNKTVPGN